MPAVKVQGGVCDPQTGSSMLRQEYPFKKKAVSNDWRLPQLVPLQKMGCSSVLWKTL